MRTPFRLLVAYDGSQCADAMIEDLQHAGIPQHAHVLVVSVAERMLPPPSIYEVVAVPAMARGRDQAVRLAQLGASQVAARHPEWIVEHEGHSGSPARTIVQRAMEWEAQLVVVGSLGHNALEQMFIGSVSQKVANEAHCSVRISRGRRQPGSLKLLLAYDARPGAAMAAVSIASRNWPSGTEVHLVAAVGFDGAPLGEFCMPADQARVEALLATVIQLLKNAGLQVYVNIQEADPKNLIVGESMRQQAHCIFAGCNEHSIVDLLLLGTVSNALVSRAPSAVEIVR